MKTISKKAAKKAGRSAKKVAANADAGKAKLEGLATEIQAGHRRCVEALRGVVTQAAAIGTSLNEAKQLVGHGGWKAWVEENCRFTLRMAQNYMLVARHHKQIAAQFGTDDRPTLTDFIAAAHELEHARRGKTRSAATKAEAKADPFRLPEEEVARRERRFRDEARVPECDRVAKERVVEAFVREKIDALYAAVRRFVESKEVSRLAANGLDATDIGMLLVESLKAALDPAGVIVAAAGTTAATVKPAPVAPPEVTASEAGEHLSNGKYHAALTV